MFPFFQFANSPLLPPPPPRHLRICQRFSVKSFRKRVTLLSCVSSRPGSPTIYNTYYMCTKKQISEVEEKSFTSSLNICPEAGGGGRSYAFPPSPPPYFQLIPGFFLFKDDVTVVLRIVVSYMVHIVTVYGTEYTSLLCGNWILSLKSISHENYFSNMRRMNLCFGLFRK